MGALAGRVAIVTGASRGIGKAIAMLFAQEGAAVVLAARSETESASLPGTIHTTAAQITAVGGTALAMKTDVRFDEEVEALVARTVAVFGGVDVLVNNAAAQFPARVKDLSVKRWDVVLNVNLRGSFLCIKTALPHLIERKGTIINITSRSAQMTGTRHDGGLAYGVSKVAINKLTLGLAEELRVEGVSVNAVQPKTAVATEGVLRAYGGPPSYKTVGPENMAQAVLYLAQQTPVTRTGWIGFDEDLRAETRAW